MAIKYIQLMGMPHQIEQIKNTISSFNLHGTVLNEEIIRQGLVTMEIKIEGSNIDIERITKHFKT